jgi:tetratricopeptide (TPR) repeat protein
MYYLLIEINSYAQLQRLSSSVVEVVTGGLRRVVEAQGGRHFSSGSGQFVYAFGQDDEFEPFDLVNGGFLCYEFLESHAAELRGFSVLMERCTETSTEAVLRELRSLLYAVPTDQGLWIGAVAYREFSAYLDLKATGTDLWLVAGRKGGAVGRVRRPDSFWIRPEPAARLFDALEPFLNGTTADRFLLVYGPTHTGKRENVEYVLSEVAGKSAYSDWVVLSPAPAPGPAALLPVINALRNPLFSRVPRYLSRSAQESWRDVSPVLAGASAVGTSTSRPDRLTTDVLIGFELFLRAYSRSMAERLLPPVVICEGLHAYEEPTVEILEHVFTSMLPSRSLIPICLSRKAGIFRELSVIPHTQVHWTPLSAGEVRSRIESMELSELVSRHHDGVTRVRGVCRGRIPACYHLLWRMGLAESAPNEGADAEISHPLDITWNALKAMEPTVSVVLYALDLSQGILDEDQLTEFLLGYVADQAALANYLDRLRNMGFIRRSPALASRFPPLRARLQELMKSQGERTAHDVAAFAAEQFFQGRVRASASLLRLQYAFGRPLDAVSVLRRLLAEELDRRNLQEAHQLIDEARRRRGQPRPSEARVEHEQVLDTAALRMALLSSKREEAAPLVRSWETRGWDTGTRAATAYHADPVLQLARFRYATGELGEALTLAKRALMRYQDRNDLWGEANATLELGTVLLAQAKVEESVEYFLIAERSATQAGDEFAALRSSAYQAVAYRIYGNLSKAARIARSSLSRAERVGSREWHLFLVLLEARALFALGRYGAAEERCQHGVCLSELYAVDAARRVFRAWMGRSAVYAGNRDRGAAVLAGVDDSEEARLFLAESYHFAGRNDEACAVLTPLTTEPAALRPASEMVSWQDGFAACEDRVFPVPDLGCTVAYSSEAFRAYLTACEDGSDTGRSALARMMRQAVSWRWNPYLSTYLYFYAMVLSKTGGGANSSEADNRLTVLSKALKDVQERSSRIDEPGKKISFLQSSYWNARMMQEARRLKLV